MRHDRVDPAAAAGAALRVVARAYPRLLVAWLPVVLAHVVIAAAFSFYLARAGLLAKTRAFSLEGQTLTVDEMMRVMGVGGPLGILSLVAALVGWVLVARAVSRTLAPGFVIPKTPWRAALGLAAALVLLYVAGGLLVLVPFLVFFHWFAYAPAALATRGLTVGDALDASRRFARDRRTHGFTALMLLALLALLLVLPVATRAIHATFLGMGVPLLLAEWFAPALAAWFLAPVLPAFPAAFWTLAHHAPAAPPPRVHEAKAAPSPVPPLVQELPAPPPPRRGTTKCPRCGTLVVYAPTGEPVEVACHECGQRGRVI